MHVNSVKPACCQHFLLDLLPSPPTQPAPKRLTTLTPEACCWATRGIHGDRAWNRGQMCAVAIAWCLSVEVWHTYNVPYLWPSLQCACQFGFGARVDLAKCKKREVKQLCSDGLFLVRGGRSLCHPVYGVAPGPPLGDQNERSAPPPSLSHLCWALAAYYWTLFSIGTTTLCS